jgi:hypothetical protein
MGHLFAVFLEFESAIYQKPQPIRRPRCGGGEVELATVLELAAEIRQFVYESKTALKPLQQ